MAESPGTNHARLKELFGRLESLGADERSAALDDELGDEPELRAELEELLRISDSGDSTIFEPIVRTGADPREDDRHPKQIGPYTIESLLGRGGMARVYRATQEAPMRRTVALKVVRRGFDADSVLDRFESERLALARLQHRNVATVLAAGADPYGPSWFSMELVDGPPITSHCEQRALSIEDRLRLFIQVCRGVQHAHLRGVLHRDLKPSNILVAMEDGEAVPKIIDFGVAKALGADSPLAGDGHTLDTQLVGTLEYMSPEQARFGNPDVDARSDVYALGVVLYELLTGRVPIGDDDFENTPLDRVQSLIHTKQPTKPSAATDLDLPAEFDYVVLKALEKDPCRRYESAKELADDVQRFLDGRPLQARSPTRLYVISKLARRHRTLTVFALLLGSAVLLGLIGTSIGFLKATQRGDQLAAALEREQAQDEQLQRMLDFQSARIGETDLAAMGLVLREGLLSVIPDESLDTLDPAVSGADFVEVARRGFAESLIPDAVSAAEIEFRDDPAMLASVLHDLAASATDLGLYRVARPVQQRAVALRTGHLGSDDEDTLRSRTSMAVIVAYAGDTDEASIMAESARADAAARFGEDHTLTIAADEVIANIRRRQGDHKQAERLFRSAMQRRERTEGPNSEGRLRNMSMLANVLSRSGEYEEAERYGRQALELRRALLDPDDPSIYISHGTLAASLFRLGRHEEAEHAARSSIEGLTRVLGLRHPHTLNARGSLASVLHSRGEHDEAIALSRDIYETRRTEYGEENPETIITLNNLASMLATSGNNEEAAELSERAYEIRTRRLGPNHPDTLSSANTVGMAARAVEDHERALRYYRIAFDGRHDTLGPAHPNTLISMRNVVGELLTLERIDEGAALAEELVERAEASLPEGHWHNAIYRVERGRAWVLLGRLDDAERELTGAHAVLLERFGEYHRFVQLTERYIDELHAKRRVLLEEPSASASTRL